MHPVYSTLDQLQNEIEDLKLHVLEVDDADIDGKLSVGSEAVLDHVNQRLVEIRTKLENHNTILSRFKKQAPQGHPSDRAW